MDLNDNKSIRRVLVLGNGFDLAVGRKTSYKNFYESEYCPKFYPAPLIMFLNEKLGKDIDKVRWLDMENALQEYANTETKIKKNKDFSQAEVNVFKYYYDKMFAYLQPSFPPSYQNEAAYFANAKERLFKRGYFDYDKMTNILSLKFDVKELNKDFEEREKQSLLEIENGLSQYIEKEGEKHTNTNAFIVHTLKHYLDNHDNVYSFNYTRIGNLLTDDAKLAEKYDSMIHYMHGSVSDGHVIIGAKDGNYGDYDFVQKAFDPQFNPPPLLREMMGADEVVIYGHSLGDCDSQYFEPFFKHLVETTDDMDKKVVIYTYDDNAVVQIKKNLQKMTGNRLSWLYSMREFGIFKTKKENKTSE